MKCRFYKKDSWSLFSCSFVTISEMQVLQEGLMVTLLMFVCNENELHGLQEGLMVTLNSCSFVTKLNFMVFK